MNNPTIDQVKMRDVEERFQNASEKAQKHAAYARVASRRGKKFKNVCDVQLKLNYPYFIRRAWRERKPKNGNFVTTSRGNPCLAMWGLMGWQTIDGLIPASTGTFDTIEVWS